MSQHHQHNLLAKQIKPHLKTTLTTTKNITPLQQFQQTFLQIHDKKRNNQNKY